jgi:glyoxylase-like metal-dependent hydrolase (beta-lactamase superfamily II)
MQLLEFLYQKRVIKDWREVFDNPLAIALEAFTTGSVLINRRGTINPEHPRATDVEEEELEVPILSYWIHHEEKGDYLLDAGLDAAFYQDLRGGLEGSEVDEFHQEKDENIAHHLEEKGIRLEGVFFSHLHADHAAGQRELSKDIPYVVSKGEYDDYTPEDHGGFLEGLEVLYEIDFSRAEEIPPLGPSVDLFGDGSLWAVLTPGHTRGHVSFLVNGYDGPVFLTMDAAFIRENLEVGVSPSDYTWDVEKAQETLEKIIIFLEEYPQVRVQPGHEHYIV